MAKLANWNSIIPSQFKPSGFISALRTFLGGRNFKPNVRMVDEVSSPTQPPPDVPGGPNHTVFNNYYCTRDGRREVTQPVLIFENNSKLIENTKKPDTEPGCPSKAPLPGKVFHWD